MPAQTSPAHQGPAHPAALNAATPTPMPKAVLCPYCGHLSLNTVRCESCRGYFDPLSRQASQNSMGPWFIRDESLPFRPGCSFDTLRQLIRRGKVTRDTVIRGPATRQFWGCARNVPGVANLLGECHACHAAAESRDESCSSCGASFFCETDRQYFGLFPVHLLPGHSSPESIAASTLIPSGGPVQVPSLVPIQQSPPATLQSSPLTPALDRLAAPGVPRRGRQGRITALAAVLGFACMAMAGVIAFLLLERQAATVPATVPAPSVAPSQPVGPLPQVQSSPAATGSKNHESPQEPVPIDEESDGDGAANTAPMPNDGPGAFAPKADDVEIMLAEAHVLLHANFPEALAQAEVLLRKLRESADPVQVSKIDNQLAFIEIRRAQHSLNARL